MAHKWLYSLDLRIYVGNTKAQLDTNFRAKAI